MTQTQTRSRPRRPKPTLRVSCLGEPDLLFGEGQRENDPKYGITNYGPHSINDLGRHRNSIRVGIIGSGETVAMTNQWLSRCQHEIEPICARSKQSLGFPGFNPDSPFRSQFVVDPSCVKRLGELEINAICDTIDRRKGFELGLDLVAKEVRIIAENYAPDVIIVALPQNLYEACRSVGGRKDRMEMTPAERKLQRLARRQQKSRQEILFDKYDVDSDQPLAYRSFRRALKARVMKWSVPIQIMLPRAFFDESSLVSFDDKLAAIKRQGVQEPATRAWNFCTAMYYKANGIPWRLASVPRGTCFVGVSFYRQDTVKLPHMHSSLAQLFTDGGDALVLRGESFEWQVETQGSPHISREHAHRLVERVVRTYEEHVRRKPERLVVHKTSRFTEDERLGFTDGVNGAGIHQRDFVALTQRDIRAFRRGEYPPVRGTLIEFPRAGALLYAMGYIPSLDTYPRGHVPRPLEIIERWTDSDLSTVCREILGLTKLNWNTADHAGSFPITLRFARRVGEVLSEVTDDEPHPHYRFYV